MKILFVIPSYEPAWAFGGTVTATVNLCRALVRKGVDVSVYTTNADGKGGYLDVPLNKPVDLGGVKVWYFRCDFIVNKAFHSKDLTYKFKETVKEFDIVDVSAIWQLIQVYVSKICGKYGVPYVVTPHSSLMEPSFKEVGNQLLKNLYWRMFAKHSIKCATALRFLSQGEREFSENYSLNTPSFIVPNGLDILYVFNKIKNFNKQKLREEIGVDLNTVMLLYLGRIHPKKNLDIIINSLNLIKDKNFHLYIIGPVEDKNYFIRLRKLIKDYDLKHKIKWLPPVEHEKVFYFYFLSDLFLLPSRSEGVSMAITEAQLCGLPILISNRVANWKEIQEDKAGIIIEPNISDLLKYLDEIIQSPNILSGLSDNARKSAEKRYDINKVADLMIKAYEDILTGRRSPELQWK